MKNTEAITKVKNAKVAYEQAVAHKMNVTAKKQEYINILLSNADALIAAADEAAEYEEQFVLECAESARLRNELNKLKTETPNTDNTDFVGESDSPSPKKLKKNG